MASNWCLEDLWLPIGRLCIYIDIQWRRHPSRSKLDPVLVYGWQLSCWTGCFWPHRRRDSICEESYIQRCLLGYSCICSMWISNHYPLLILRPSFGSFLRHKCSTTIYQHVCHGFRSSCPRCHNNHLDGRRDPQHFDLYGCSLKTCLRHCQRLGVSLQRLPLSSLEG